MPALLLLLLLPCLAFAQPDTTWSQNFLVNDRTYLYDVAVVNDSLIVVCGNAQTGIGSNNWDFLVAAYTLDGEQLYARTYLETNDKQALESLCSIGGDTVVAVGWTDLQTDVLNLIAFSASTGDTFWTKTFTGSGQTRGRSITCLDDGRLAIVGYRLGPNNRSDMWFLLCESNGDTIFTRSTGTTVTDVGNAVLQLPNGNIRVGAQWRESTTYDQWTRVYDLDGNIVGADLFFGTDGDDFVYNMVLDPAERVWLVGRTATAGGAGYVSIIPPTGQPASLTFSSPGFSDQFMNALPWFGGMLFVGRSGNQGTYTGPFMRAIDGANGSLWTWRFGALGTEGGFYNIAQLPNGGAVAVGAYVDASDTTIVSGYLLTIAPPAGVQGVVLGASDNQPIVGARVKAVDDSRYTLTDIEGHYRLELAAGTYDVMVSGACIESDTVFGVTTVENELAQADFSVGQPVYAPLQSSINIIAQNEMIGGTVLMLGNDGTGVMSYSISAEAISPAGTWITVEPSSGVLQPQEHIDIDVIVQADTTNDNIYEFFGEVTVRSNACPDTVVTLPVLVTVLDAKNPETLPNSFGLSPAFPNPFNGTTTLNLQVPVETELRLEVFNIEGKWLKTLIDGRVSAGIHNINVDLAGQATGVYIARAQSAEAISTQKLLYIR